MKFNEYPYSRPDLEQTCQEIDAIVAAVAQAKTFPQADDGLAAFEALQKRLQTMYSVASIRFTLNTADEFYKGEQDYYDETMPLIEERAVRVYKALLACPFRKEIDKKYGSQFLSQAEIAVKRVSPELIPFMQEENRLRSEYQALASSMSVEYQGEKCNNYGLLKFMEHPDRDIRQGAFHAWAGWFAENEEKLGALYDRLVHLRDTMGKALGYADFTPLGYLNMSRSDYGPEQVKKYREQVVKYIVPVCTELHKRQAKRIGVDHLRYYDESFLFPDGNADPIGDRAYLVEAASKMYHEMSKETGEFFDFMIGHELLELDTKPNKAVGGYCTFMPDYDSPFIFSNFNGSAADAGVLTHEAGHAFEVYCASRQQPLIEYCWSTSEVNEIHSMSMEYFTYPWMGLFFGKGEKKNRFTHMSQALEFIPYGCCVDEYQHIVYANPGLTPAQRTAAWKELEKKYLPDRDYDGVDVMERGGFWMQKLHIFLNPFYYIDYTLASMGAFEFFGRMQENRQQAWADYCKLCRAGGSLPYLELLKLANLSNPFEEGTVQKAIAPLVKELMETDDTLL